MKFNLNIENYEKERWYLFGLYCLLNILFLYLINDVIITDPQYFTGGNENSAKLFRNMYKAIYLINPIYAFIKIAFITLLLKFGAALYCNLQLSFRQLFTLVIFGEFVLLLPNLIEVIWFLFVHTNYTMVEVKYFVPFSLYSLFEPGEMKDSYNYVFELINPFELAYWFILILGLENMGTKSKLQGLKIISGSYGLFLILIILFRWLIYSTILNHS